MNWFLIVYFVVLVYLALNKDKIADKCVFRGAWISYAIVPLLEAVFTLFRAGNYSNHRKLALVEIWHNGFTWLFLGISLIFLLNALVPGEGDDKSVNGEG